MSDDPKRTVYVRVDKNADPREVLNAIDRFRKAAFETVEQLALIPSDPAERMQPVYVDRGTNTIADLSDMRLHDANAPLNSYLITRINVPHAHRRKGHGSAMLRRICDDADRTLATLYTQPLSSGHLSNRALRAWYERYGFERRELYYVRMPRIAKPVQE